MRAQPAIQALRVYDPGHDLVALRRAAAPRTLVELGSNENPYGPSPRVRIAIDAVLSQLHRYPDPRGGDLKRALAQRNGVDVEQIVLGNGSHELLMQLAQVFAGPDCDVLVPQYGFAVFAIAAAAVGARAVVVPALPATHAMPRGHDLDAMRAAITPATRLLYLANPNNPTGTWIADGAFAAFIAQLPRDVLVVVDEAYAEIADAPDHASALRHLGAYPNLVVTRTFSKAYALAGLRIGYAIGSKDVIALLERVRESFNLGVVALAAAQAALADDAYLRDTVARTIVQRERLANELRGRGWTVSPSQANFLLVEFGARTADIESALRARDVVLRPMGGYGLPECLRISVGDDDEQRRLLAALDAIVETGS
ncbi:MAG: histidinol-phosphate transaminase [Luteimonas sp.]